MGTSSPAKIRSAPTFLPLLGQPYFGPKALFHNLQEEANKTIWLKGTLIDPSADKECDMRETVKIIDDDNQLMEMYGPDPKTGREFKSMTIKLTRKK